MKIVWGLISFVAFFHILLPHAYIDSLDSFIEQKIKLLPSENLQAISILDQIESAINQKVSLAKINEMLEQKKFVSFFLLDDLLNYKELRFALGAKIYMYCLDCCEQKMLNKAFKNYDSLEYWKYEKVYEERALHEKNITRWIHGLEYKKQIETNITNLEKISKQTLSFLGLIRYNKQSLLQATTRESFEKNLKMALRLQDIFLNIPEHDYDTDTIYSIITTMLNQFYVLSTDLSTSYKACQPSSHLQRNIAAYTATFASISACAIIYRLYEDTIDAFIEDFWNDQCKKHVDTLSEDTRMIIYYITFLPLMSVAAGTVFASNRIYYSMTYQQIRRAIRDLDIFLNDSANKAVSFEREGKLYFLTELLKNKSEVLTLTEHRLMNEDLAELQSTNLSYQQKFHIVQRMYHTYEFLVPGTV